MCVVGGEPQDLFLSSEQVHFAKAISNLSTTGRKRGEERGWKGRRRNTALLISRVHALEVEGRSLKLNIRERNQQDTKSSGRECPLSPSDGIAKKDCCHGPLPRLFSTRKGAWELNNAHGRIVVCPPYLGLIVSCRSTKCSPWELKINFVPCPMQLIPAGQCFR